LLHNGLNWEFRCTLRLVQPAGHKWKSGAAKVFENEDSLLSAGILFQDRTYLAFDVDPILRITPDFSDAKTGNYKPLKRWPPVDSD
jgi:hypothetical protein